MITPPFYQWFNDASAVVGLFGGGEAMRIYRDELPQRCAYPAIRWQLVSGTPENYMDGPPGIDNGRFQFDIFAPTQDACDAAQVAVLEVLEAEGYVVSYNGTGRDELTKQYFTSFDLSLWQER